MKEYEKPILIEDDIELIDIIAKSTVFGGNEPGDVEANWPFN